MSGDTGRGVLLGTARSLCSWAHHPMIVLTFGRPLSMLVACYADLRDIQNVRFCCGAGRIVSQRFMMCVDHKIARNDEKRLTDPRVTGILIRVSMRVSWPSAMICRDGGTLAQRLATFPNWQKERKADSNHRSSVIRCITHTHTFQAWGLKFSNIRSANRVVRSLK